MKNMVVRRSLKLIVLVVIMIFLNNTFSFLLKNTNLSAEANIYNFYREPPNSIDVAVIGSSEIFAGYSPVIAFDKFGFTSYNLGFSTSSGCQYNSMLEEFLKRQNPQLVVIEVNGFLYDEKFQMKESTQRLWIDNMRKSANWANMICDNIPWGERINYFLNITKYHSNWKNYDKQYARIENLIRNNEGEVSFMKSFVTESTQNSEYEKEKTTRCLNDFGRECLINTLDYCKSCGLTNVLFIRAPHLNHLEVSSNDEIQQLVNESGYQYINFDILLDDIGIDPYIDLYNNEHLNVFGNEKFTEYLGRYIMNNYAIDTTHSEKIDALWKECYEYTADVFEILKEKTLNNEGDRYWEYSDYSSMLVR